MGNMSLVVPEGEFQYVLRIVNTNVDGAVNVVFALTAIKGVGRRFAGELCRLADIDRTKRAGELTDDEMQKLVTILQHPTQFEIPTWFLNRQRDIRDGKNTQLYSNYLDNNLREDMQRMRKIRSHRGIRHAYGLKVRGQHTKTTGRRGRTVGVAKKK